MRYEDAESLSISADSKPLFTIPLGSKPASPTIHCDAPANIIFTCIVFDDGDVEHVRAHIDQFFCVIRPELPIYVPLADCMVPINASSIRFGELLLDCRSTSIRVRKKQRGSERFQMDLSALPYFTALSIMLPFALNTTRTDEGGRPFENSIIKDFVNSLLGLLDDTIRDAGIQTERPLASFENFSLVIDYFRRGDSIEHRKPFASCLYPTTRAVRAPDPKVDISVSFAEFEKLNAIRVELCAQSTSQVSSYNKLEFNDRILRIVHDFGFYSRQHAGTLSQLAEEEMRDLLIIPLKILMGPAEAEAKNYTGRADVKVTSESSRYQYSIIELKWWRGESSYDSIESQLLLEHTTGQESLLVAIVLSKGKSLSRVEEQLVAALSSNREIRGVNIGRDGFSGTTNTIRGEAHIRDKWIPICCVVFDLYYHNPRIR